MVQHVWNVQKVTTVRLPRLVQFLVKAVLMLIKNPVLLVSCVLLVLHVLMLQLAQYRVL